MSGAEVVRSHCGWCMNACGVLIKMKDGMPVEIVGDPDAPVNHGRLCAKGSSALEYVFHPNRLKHPLRRMGARGENSWKQISWDEALTIVADRLKSIKSESGPEAVSVVVQGAAKGMQDGYASRFSNVFGTPNIVRSSHICHFPGNSAARITLGFNPTTDDQYPTFCFVVWGSNPAHTDIHSYHNISEAKERGAKLIVIDPLKTELAEKADVWLQLRPGTDLALALGMIHVIVSEELYAKDFVEKWTYGFDRLRDHIQGYSPEKVEGITWVKAAAIRDAARMYATNKPARIPWGNALDQNLNSFQNHRATMILRAITGNLDIPGGEVSFSKPPLPWLQRFAPALELQDKLPKSVVEKKLGADLRFLPSLPCVPWQLVIKSILTGKPYLTRALYVQGSNPLVTWQNAGEVYEALTKIEFLVVADMFMTPSAALADVVLPAASWLEFDSIGLSIGRPLAQIRQKVAQVGEARSDYAILSPLAKKLGLGEYFWDTEEQLLDQMLKPAGLTFREFRQIVRIQGAKTYRTYEPNGFDTPSKKVELYSDRLKKLGFDPLPVYYEPLGESYSAQAPAGKFDLVMTNRKLEFFRHAGGKDIAPLRRRHPDPCVMIHEETAHRLGINEGDWVYVETERGKILQKAVISNSTHPKVVVADFGWWFPEAGAKELFRWSESNLNILTDSDKPYGRELGTPNIRGILCRVSKAPEGVKISRGMAA